MRLFRVISVCFILIVSAVAQSAPATDTKLPVRRVVLYKNGVGYFEHSGHVTDAQQVSISFTTAQLNDVLKSLTVLDRGNGHITGVSYNSTAPVEQRLQSLRLPIGENVSQADFLRALRGARVEVRSGTIVLTGRLLSIDSREVKRKDETTTTIDTVSLVTDNGEVRSFDLTPSTGVRILERDLNEEIGRYLNVISSEREQDVRRMTISTAGTGERELFVSYISEVPVWKSTYRIVLPTRKDAKPLLQGWAIVDNTVGEDWKNVQLSLVAGAPQSFIQQLATPYYARRPQVGLPETAMLSPQTHEQTMASEVVNGALRTPAKIPEKVQMMQEDKEAPSGVPGGTMGGVLGGVIGAPAQSRTVAESMGVGPGQGGGIGGGFSRVGGGVRNFANEVESQYSSAASRDLGDLFEYSLKEPVTIRKDQSALVPIVQARVDAEKVTMWSANPGRPLRALWLTNNSGLTLDGGSFNVLEEGTFSGEGLVDAMKPGEKRLLSYAADLGVRVESKLQNERQHVAKVTVFRGVMTHSTEWRERQTYTVRNENTETRTVIIEHPVRRGYKLADSTSKPDETTASFYRFRVKVEPKETATLTVEEFRPVSSTYYLSNLTDDQIEMFVQQKTIDAATEKALRRILTQKGEVGGFDNQIASRQKEMTSIFDDQQRVRENLKALKGSAEEKELTQRYTRQLNQQEDRVQSLRTEVDGLRGKRDQAQAELNRMVQDLQLEATL
jgi:hypothetical protein